MCTLVIQSDALACESFKFTCLLHIFPVLSAVDSMRSANLSTNSQTLPLTISTPSGSFSKFSKERRTDAIEEAEDEGLMQSKRDDIGSASCDEFDRTSTRSGDPVRFSIMDSSAGGRTLTVPMSEDGSFKRDEDRIVHNR